MFKRSCQIMEQLAQFHPQNHDCVGFKLSCFLAIRWRHFSSKLHHQVAPLAWKLVQQMAPIVYIVNLATNWNHLHELHIWPPDGAIRKFGHQVGQIGVARTTFGPSVISIWPKRGPLGPPASKKRPSTRSSVTADIALWVRHSRKKVGTWEPGSKSVFGPN